MIFEKVKLEGDRGVPENEYRKGSVREVIGEGSKAGSNKPGENRKVDAATDDERMTGEQKG